MSVLLIPLSVILPAITPAGAVLIRAVLIKAVPVVPVGLVPFPPNSKGFGASGSGFNI